MRKAYPALIDYARALRRSMTPAEAALWAVLRKRAFGRFRRQHPIAGFILDFYCPAARLCIEVDGAVHDLPSQRCRDQARTARLASMGIRVVRFRNEEVLHNLPLVLRRIHEAVTESTDGLPETG